MNKRAPALIPFIFVLFAIQVAVADPLPSGNSVYSSAVDAMRAIAQPAYATYDIETTQHGLTMTMNCEDGKHPSITVSTAGGTTTTTSHVTLRGSDNAARIVETGKPEDLICVPFPFALTYGTKLVIGNGAASQASVLPSDVIAEVTTHYNSAYRIENAGTESLKGAPVYHLKLIAIDPQTHHLTDMYVDTSNHRVRALAFRNGKRGMLNGGEAFGRLDFGPAGNYWVLTGGRIDASGHMLFFHAAGDVEFTLQNMTFPAILPAGEFTVAK